MIIPGKHPDLIPFGDDRLNCGPPPELVAGELLTPNDRFFTRSHAPAPAIDPEAWRLRIDGLVDRPMELSLRELTTRFRPAETTATLVCAGMRRREFLELGPLPGELAWATEPIGTARWSGVELRDVLETAGLTRAARYVAFTGLDAVERLGSTFGFGGSISVEKAHDPSVLIALEMNGEPLSIAHGFPARIVVPGWIGARSVKWLDRIEIRAEPSDNYFQARAYRMQRKANPRDSRDVTAGSPLEEIALNAVLLRPFGREALRAGPVLVEGWAIGTGCQPVTSVELSVDGGNRWQIVELDAPSAGRATWQLFRATVTLDSGHHELVVRAFDATGATQPPQLADAWNVKGYANNAWHRLPVRVGD